MPMVEEIVNNVLIKETFDENRTQLLVDQVVDRTMAALSELKMPMKFVVSCIIVQNNGAGWSSSTVTHCDRRSDDYLEYVWPNKKMKEASTCHLNAWSLWEDSCFDFTIHHPHHISRISR